MYWRLSLLGACLFCDHHGQMGTESVLANLDLPLRKESSMQPSEAIVFYDADYDSSWVEHASEVANWFVRRRFAQKNVPELRVWLQDKIGQNAAPGTSVVFAMGIAPTSIVYPPYDDCLLAHYLKAGGRVVWLGNIPMYVAQGETGSAFTYGEVPRQTMLGLSSDPQTFYGAEGPTLTSAGLSWGLEPVNTLARPVRHQGLTACFFSDPTSEHCGVGLVNLRPDIPLGGFIFMPDYLDPSREALLRNAYRLAKWAGDAVTIPEPTPLPEDSAPFVATLRLGAEDTRSTFLRGEVVPLYLRVKLHDAPSLAASVVVKLSQGSTTLQQWSQFVTVSTKETDVLLGRIELDGLRRGVYRISVTFEGIDDFDDQPMTLTRDVRIAPRAEHEGTHVALWVEPSPSPRRTMDVLDWLDNHDLQPLFSDDHPTGRDLALWYGQSFSVRRIGNSMNAPAPMGHDSWRRGANGEIMPVLAWGNKRVAMGYANPFRREMEADDFGRQISFDATFPAFRRRAVTNDDYSQWFGLDYNAFATEGFFARYGIDAPRPAMLEDSTELSRVPPPPPGIIPDNDPWILLNRYWCEEVHGDTALRLSHAMAEKTDGLGKVGQIAGGMQIPVMFVPTGQYPPYSMGRAGYSLLSFYYYNQLWQPPLAHLWWLEVARMGNRTSEQWIMPDAGYEGVKASALYDHFGWLMLAGGATGIEYFNDDSMTPGGIMAMTKFGRLSKEYGMLLGKLVPARKNVGLLVPFEQLVYKPSSAYEFVYPFMGLLQANVDVEPVSPDELDATNIHEYEAILVMQTQWLKASTAALLAAYAQNGGKLILDAPSAQYLDIPGAIVLSLPTGDAAKNQGPTVPQIAQIKDAITDIVTPPIDGDDPDVTLRRFEAFGTPYVYVNHQMTNVEYATYRQSNFQDDTLADRLGYGQNVISTRLVRSNDRRIPFDVFAHRPLPVEVHHGRMQFVVSIPQWQGRLVAFLPELPRRIQSILPRKTLPGARNTVRIRVLGRHGGIDTLFPLHVTVTDPRGRTSKEYSQRLLARHGTASFTIQFAKNDLPGRWTLAVRDAMTQIEGRTSIELQGISLR